MSDLPAAVGPSKAGTAILSPVVNLTLSSTTGIFTAHQLSTGAQYRIKVLVTP
jgi:hypothetical protein